MPLERRNAFSVKVSLSQSPEGVARQSESEFAAILLEIGTKPCIWIKDGLKDQSDAFLRITC